MPESSSYLVFVLAALALLLVPGPSVLYIVTRSVSQGRVAGIISVLGIQCGALGHVAAATLGLSAILLSSALAFNLVKYAGAAYLIYMGVQQWRSKARPEQFEMKPEALSRVFSQGFVVNLFNPKTALFFLAFLPQFVNPARGSVSAQFLILGLTFVGLASVTDSLYALLSSAIGGWLKSNERFQRSQKYVTGGVYVGLGVTAALTGSHK